MLIISNIYYCYLYYFYYENCYRQFYITVTSWNFTVEVYISVA